MDDKKVNELFEKFNTVLKEADITQVDALSFLSTFSAVVIRAMANEMNIDWQPLVDKFYECLNDTCENLSNPNENKDAN